MEKNITSESIAQLISDNFEKEEFNNVLEQIATKILGPMPEWSEIDHYRIVGHDQADVGSGAFLYGKNDDGAYCIALIERGPATDEKLRYGILGGFLSFRSKEQPNEAVLREIKEESVDDKGNSILDIDFCRFELHSTGIDYRNPSKFVVYIGFKVELNAEEITAIKEHNNKIVVDCEYAANVLEKSNYEVKNIHFIPIEEVIKMSPDQFAHPHELDGIKDLAKSFGI